MRVISNGSGGDGSAWGAALHAHEECHMVLQGSWANTAQVQEHCCFA
jgi:hypothetical protein